MKAAIATFMAVVACSNSSPSSSSGPQQCADAGGQCIIGSNPCPNKGSQDCNPDKNPGGAICCLPCPSGTNPNDAGTACQ
jgi:hypothetical protein